MHDHALSHVGSMIELVALIGLPSLLAFLGLIFGVLVLLHRRQTKVEVARPGLWAVTGGFGAGKTYLLAWAANRALKAGRPVYANFHIQGARYLSSWLEVQAVPDDAFVALAELHLWWPVEVRVSPPGIDQWVSQLRHHKITCLWDSQHWMFVNTKFRRLTMGVWEGKKEAGGHRYSLFDAYNFGRTAKVRVARMRVRRSKAVMASYNTHEDVQGHLDWVPLAMAQRRGSWSPDSFRGESL